MKYILFVFFGIVASNSVQAQLTCNGVTIAGACLANSEVLLLNTHICCSGGPIVITNINGHGILADPPSYRTSGDGIIDAYDNVRQIITINSNLLDTLNFDLYVKSSEGSAELLSIEKYRELDLKFVEYKLAKALEPKDYLILIPKDKAKAESYEIQEK